MIYWRQNVMLALLEKAPTKKVSRIQFIKWLFLLKEEQKINRFGSFYDFLPYKYGPFSFLAYRDISKLEQIGLIKSDKKSFQYSGSVPMILSHTLPVVVTHSVERIIIDYGTLSQQHLLEYVYEKYPWYASKADIRKPMSPNDTPQTRPAIYSLGYESLSIDAFLDIILRAGIRRIIDCRNNPVSRKYGFSKHALEKRCLDIGITYEHFPELGIPSEMRSQIDQKSVLWDFYMDQILSSNSAILDSIADTSKELPSVLICFEKNPEDCHRHIVAKKISVRTGLSVLHYHRETSRWVTQ